MSATVPDAALGRKASREARLPFYYGWLMVVLASLAMSATLPGGTYGLGLIKEPLRASLDIGDLRFNVLNFWAIILGAAVVPPVGWLIDRFGARVVLTAVSAALGGCVLAMSRAWDETSLFVTLTLVRGLGQGALSVVAIARSASGSSAGWGRRWARSRSCWRSASSLRSSPSARRFASTAGARHGPG